MERNSQSRRNFLGNVALGTIGAIGAAKLLSSCSGPKVELDLPPLLDQAPDGAPLKAGLIGCGGRGTGAAINFLNAGPNLSLVAMADVFEDRMAGSRERIKNQTGTEVADENCFLGFDAYKKVIESDVDIVILATPPYFRPQMFAECIEARKHVFMEKPVAVDPVGARSIISSAKKAETIGLTVITGTQRHHQRDYIEVYKRVMQGEIGDILSANAYWNQNQLWYKSRQPEWTDMEFMLRDWVNWNWLSGDHIVEQHVHNIDVVHWFMGGKFPTKAVGFGSRHRRVTGDQYDNFSVDFTFEGDIHVHSMCRQINGCVGNVSEFIKGTKGHSNCKDTIWDKEGNELYTYEYPIDEATGEPTDYVTISPYDQEHIDMVTAIRTNKPINEAEFTAKSTLAAIMGRISAYTGKEVTWEEMMQSNLKLGPDTDIANLEFGANELVNSIVPVPGSVER
jgi:predicted dehydrogenase